MGLTPHQVLAVCGATVGLAFAFQWLFGVLRLASLSRFLPISVTHGFAAGVGMSMVIGQVRGGFGSGGWAWDGRVLAHAAAAVAVVLIARLVQWRWRQLPGLLPAVVLVAAVIGLFGMGGSFAPAVGTEPFAWPTLPDWVGVSWSEVIRRQGMHLVSLAFLMAVVNSLEILVFNQELDLEHGLRGDANRLLRHESLLGAVCGLFGFIPASTSASRSRIALAQAGPVASVGPNHAAIMLLVAVTGHWWLHWVPMACLAGGLLLAGITQVPRLLWSRAYARAASATWMQSWLVAMVFTVEGGAGALVAGLVVATFVLLHASASNVLRRTLLDGQARSRRLRRTASEAWLAPRMQRLAIIELQGVMSFGVAAHMAEQVRQLLLPKHDRVILDASRVAAWDATALVQLRALARDLAQRRVQLVACAMDGRSAAMAASTVIVFADLDRALQWAEDAMLEERSPGERPAYPEHDLLGEVGEGLGAQDRADLEAQLALRTVESGVQVFAAGEHHTEMLIVQSGHVTLSTAWPPSAGLRLATVGRGMAFGEMAFLTGEPRSACAGAEGGPVELACLPRSAFDAWAQQHPAAALTLMGNLAHIGTRRLGATTRQLRAVLE